MQDSETFVRTVYAGNAIMTLKSLDPVKVQKPSIDAFYTSDLFSEINRVMFWQIVTVRTTAFEAAAPSGGSAAEEAAPAGEASTAGTSEFVGQV